MTIPSNPQEPFTPFLPTTYNIPENENNQEYFLNTQFANFADVINDKKIGIYLEAAETFGGEKWWYKTTQITRNSYQTIAYIPSFPNTGVLTLTLTSDPVYPITDVNDQLIVTQVYGSASKPCSAVGAGDGIYFSFMSEGDSRVSFVMTDISITITTTIDMSAYSGFIVCQYLRNGT